MCQEDQGEGGHHGLSENGPHRLIRLNICFVLGGTVWEGLGIVAMLYKVCHYARALRFQKFTTFLVNLSTIQLMF